MTDLTSSAVLLHEVADQAIEAGENLKYVATVTPADTTNRLQVAAQDLRESLVNTVIATHGVVRLLPQFSEDELDNLRTRLDDAITTAINGVMESLSHPRTWATDLAEDR
jgi:hypothetical protein